MEPSTMHLEKEQTQVLMSPIAASFPTRRSVDAIDLASTNTQQWATESRHLYLHVPEVEPHLSL